VELEAYDVALVIAGLAALGAAVVPRLLHERPLSFPIVYVALGFVAFSLPLGLPDPDPLEHPQVAERVTELTVIVALMGAGLKLDRRIGWRTWASTWRLLAVAMPLTIAGVALAGWWIAGLAPAAAFLLGAVIAPTDPVLASDVQVPGPGDEEDEVRFALTSEAGLNDGLAFPFTNAAIAAVGAATLGDWVGGWFLDDVLLKVSIGLVVGLALGKALALFAFRGTRRGRLAEHAEGFVALGATLLVYGVTELLHGYGFLAVFVASVTLRQHERDAEWHGVLHDYAEETERLLGAALLVLLGGAIHGGILGPISWQGIVVAVLTVFLIRPVTGVVSMVGMPCPPHERLIIAFFGIRGIGSAYYLAHALNEAAFEEGEALWAVVSLIVLLSIVLHGVVAGPTMVWADERAKRG
jgi:NhaP-type Na+/H+ or K+/H+ antiporter